MRTVVAIIGLAVALLLGACDAKVAGTDKKADPHWVIASLKVVGASDLDDESHAALKANVASAFADSVKDLPMLSMSGSGAPLKGELVFEWMTDPEKESKGIVLHLNLVLEGEDSRGPFKFAAESWSAIEPSKGEAVTETERRAADRATGELSRQLDAQVKVLAAEGGALEPWLTDSEPETLRFVMHELVRRDRRDLAPAIRQLLFHPDKDVVLTALGTLAQIGDEDSVPAVFDLTSSPDAEKVDQALYALGAIGGEEAKGILERMVRSHPDPTVKRIAEEMLKKIAAREKGKE